MKILQDPDKKEIITNDLIQVYFKILDYGGRESLLKILEILRRDSLLDSDPDHILCRTAEKTPWKEYHRRIVHVKEIYNPHWPMPLKSREYEHHDAMKELLEDLTEENVRKITEYTFEDFDSCCTVEINIPDGTIMYSEDRKKALEKNGYPRYYMYLNWYIVRYEGYGYYKVNENMEWEGIDWSRMDEIWDLDDLTEEDVLRVYPREVLEKIPIDTVRYLRDRIWRVVYDSARDLSKDEEERKAARPPKVTLYSEDHIYEYEEVTACVIDHELHVTGVTSEKAPGGMYCTTEALSVEGTKVLMQLLETDEDGLLRAMSLKFGGANAESEFCEFCWEHGLEFKK